MYALSGYGSSPLARGKRHDHCDGLEGFRLIPARAGKTLSTPRLVTLRRAHPRSRGENSRRPRRSSNGQGSSPLARGKRPRRRRLRTIVGLIPARAGKTLRDHHRRRPAPAHPRSRGENPIGCPVGAARAWLIPARAGKTVCCSPCRRSRWAHPRSRGENAGQTRERLEGGGSSPLARGKRVECCSLLHERGLIPACAGKTHTSPFSPSCGAAHPRSRGENSMLGVSMGASTGSSPLARGKPRPHSHAR